MRRLILTVAVSMFSACAMSAPGRPMGDLAPEINSTLNNSASVFAPGDVLSVRFTRLPTWNQEGVIVQPDGRASFLSLDDTPVAGKTVAQLDELLTQEYTKILAQPDLTIVTTQTAPRSISVMGEVAGPGSFELPAGRLTLLEALGLASGPNRATAFLEHTLLVRWIPEENRVQAWKIDASLDQWTSEESILLQAHDVIFVPAQPVVHVNDWIDLYIRRMIPFPYLVAPSNTGN